MSEHLVRVEALRAHQRARGWTDADLARALGRSQQQIRTWFLPVEQRDARRIGERLARDIEEKLGLPRYALDMRPAEHAQLVMEESPLWGKAAERVPTTSEPWVTNATPRLIPVVEWGDFLVTGHTAPARQPSSRALETFAAATEGARFLEVQDDSMAPTFNRGDHVLIDPGATPAAGDEVLVRTSSGELHLRTFRPRTAAAFDAVALNQHYLPLNSTTDGLTIVGVCIEHRRYRRASN
jgi:SOS-response transcriptional repressor LexA